MVKFIYNNIFYNVKLSNLCCLDFNQLDSTISRKETLWIESKSWMLFVIS